MNASHIDADSASDMDTSPLIGPTVAPAFQVMSWNIRRRVVPITPRLADRWHDRAPRVRALLEVEQPTIFGAQEALPDQVRFLRDALGKNYRVIGRGRGADGRGEACPVFYDSTRFELLDWKQSALSDRPEHPGSISWGNIVPRIMVSATFRDRVSWRSFLVVNTHLDHLSRHSRLRSVRVILQVLSDIRLPAVVTGDFNSGADSAPLRELCAQGMLADTWEMAQTHRSPLWGTFPNYRAPRRGGHRLDWILASPACRVLSSAILLIAAWSNVLEFYAMIAWWDLVVHFFCGGVLAMGCYLLLARLGIVPVPFTHRFIPATGIVLVTALGLALGSLWEMVEWLGYTYITPDIHVTYQDTIGDMVAGGLGALCLGFVVAYRPLLRPAPAFPTGMSTLPEHRLHLISRSVDPGGRDVSSATSLSFRAGREPDLPD